MRRLLAITLLSFFCLPLLTPLLAMTTRGDDSIVPACCRRNGAHHCLLSAEQIARLTSGQQVNIVHAQCLQYPRAVSAAPHLQLALGTSGVIFNERLSQHERHRQIAAWARIAEAGARHKRGPPAVRLS